MKRNDPFEMLADKMRRVAEQVSNELKEKGIRHALIGGIAAGIYGEPRATKDVDFLISGEAYAGTPSKSGKLEAQLMTFDGVRVDFIYLDAKRAFLEDALAGSLEARGIPVIPVETLIYLKLLSQRRVDQLDIIRIIQAGVDLEVVTDYLEENAPELVADLNKYVQKADEERGEQG